MAIASDAELLHITQVYAAAMMAVIIWDWLVMIGKEYECIWKARWGLVKVGTLHSASSQQLYV